jgi:hypothetical protein
MGAGGGTFFECFGEFDGAAKILGLKAGGRGGEEEPLEGEMRGELFSGFDAPDDLIEELGGGGGFLGFEVGIDLRELDGEGDRGLGRCDDRPGRESEDDERKRETEGRWT